jgi:hypothetical protein
MPARSYHYKGFTFAITGGRPDLCRPTSGSATWLSGRPISRRVSRGAVGSRRGVARLAWRRMTALLRRVGGERPRRTADRV